jgi:hypothetical protein
MQFLDEETETIKTSLSNVSGGLKVLNFGGIKMPTSTAFGFKVNSCVDAEIGGVSHVKRTTRTGIEHQRDRQKDWLQPKDGS